MHYKVDVECVCVRVVTVLSVSGLCTHYVCECTVQCVVPSASMCMPFVNICADCLANSFRKIGVFMHSKLVFEAFEGATEHTNSRQKKTTVT